MSKLLVALACLILMAAPRPAPAEENPASIIDAEISAALARSRIAPAPRAPEVELARRLCLDLLGRIPTAAEMRDFLDDTEADRTQRLLERLLAHEELPVYWASVIDH